MKKKNLPAAFNPFPPKNLVFTFLQYKSFENTVGKGEIAPKSVFYLFGELSVVFIKFEIVACNLFEFGRV